MTSSDSVIALVQYVFGAVVIFHGVLDVQSSVSLMRQGAARWWLDLALSALTLALGALILINPFGHLRRPGDPDRPVLSTTAQRACGSSTG